MSARNAATRPDKVAEEHTLSPPLEELPSILALRPREKTTEAIGASFDAMITMRAENEIKISTLEARRAELLMTATPAAVEQNDTAVRQRRVLAEQLTLIEPELRAAFAEAKARAQDEAFANKVAAYKAAVAASSSGFAEKYQRLASELRDLLRDEAAIYEHLETLADQPGHDRRNDAHLLQSLRAAQPLGYCFQPGDQEASAAPLFQSVRLPGLTPEFGAAFWLPARWVPRSIPQSAFTNAAYTIVR